MISRIERGLKYVKEVDALVYDPAYEDDYKTFTDQEYTSMVMKEIMNGVAYDMQFTTEDQNFIRKISVLNWGS